MAEFTHISEDRVRMVDVGGKIGNAAGCRCSGEDI